MNYCIVRRKLFFATLAVATAAVVFEIAGYQAIAEVLTILAVILIALGVAISKIQKRRQKPRKSYAVAINGQRLTKSLTLSEASSLAASLCADDFLELRSKVMLPQIFEVVLV